MLSAVTCCHDERRYFRGSLPITPGGAPKRMKKCALSHIMADFRQIMWRKFLRTLCKDSTRAQTVLPHNVAWPFFPFLPSWDYPLFAAILCGRKRRMASKVAPMLKHRVLTDHVASQIFSHGLLRKPVTKKFGEVSPDYASETATTRRENHDIYLGRRAVQS